MVRLHDMNAVNARAEKEKEGESGERGYKPGDDGARWDFVGSHDTSVLLIFGVSRRPGRGVESALASRMILCESCRTSSTTSNMETNTKSLRSQDVSCRWTSTPATRLKISLNKSIKLSHNLIVGSPVMQVTLLSLDWVQSLAARHPCNDDAFLPVDVPSTKYHENFNINYQRPT